MITDHLKFLSQKGNLVLFFCFFLSINAIGQIGELHIIAEPGVRLYTDNLFFTETDSAHQDIVINDISAESHTLQCTKDGCYSITSSININRAHTTYYLAHKLICDDTLPSGELDFSGNEPSCLMVRSHPAEVHFTIPKYSIVSDKIDDNWVANNIPSGPCNIYFQYHDTDIVTTVDIIPGQQAYLFIDLEKRTVLDSIIDPCICCVPDSIGFVAISGEADQHLVMEVFEGFEVSEMASFKGGEKAMRVFVNENLIFPEEAWQAAKDGIAEVGGNSMVEFVIEPDGSINEETVQIIGRHVGYGCEEAIIQMVNKSSGLWIPAGIEDHNVRQKFRMPVALKFSL